MKMALQVWGSHAKFHFRHGFFQFLKLRLHQVDSLNDVAGCLVRLRRKSWLVA